MIRSWPSVADWIRRSTDNFKDWYSPYADVVDEGRGLIALAKTSSEMAAYDSGDGVFICQFHAISFTRCSRYSTTPIQAR